MNGQATPVPIGLSDKNVLKIRFVTLGRITVALPLLSLLICFFSAIIFQFEEVNKTVCNVPNIVPSISAITGVTPQRYIWRVGIALHCTPRLAIGFVYYNYYMRCFEAVRSQAYRALVQVLFWVYMIENSCLIGVTYIANVENYPVHEKIFVVFMITSLLYELLTLIIFKWAHPHLSQQPQLAWSYKLKKICFVSICIFTAGLLYSFLRHRWYCEPGAFTRFALCEYVMVALNILYHYSVIYEFHDLEIVGFSASGFQRPIPSDRSR